MLNKLIRELQKYSSKEKAENYKKFFKTGKGEYSEKDIFLGIRVPVQREIAKKYRNLSISKLSQLIKSKIHEHRFSALLILQEKYKNSSNEEKANIFNFYIKNIQHINNWDLVDLSAPSIFGDFLYDKDKKILYDLSRSKNFWERRISIVSTFNFIRRNHFEDTLTISELLLKDKEDLIHKAVGWMLREIGKRDKKVLEDFLKSHYKEMPRTTLRYAIEKFEEEKRKNYLKGKIE